MILKMMSEVLKNNELKTFLALARMFAEALSENAEQMPKHMRLLEELESYHRTGDRKSRRAIAAHVVTARRRTKPE